MVRKRRRQSNLSVPEKPRSSEKADRCRRRRVLSQKRWMVSEDCAVVVRLETRELRVIDRRQTHYYPNTKVSRSNKDYVYRIIYNPDILSEFREFFLFNIVCIQREKIGLESRSASRSLHVIGYKEISRET